MLFRSERHVTLLWPALRIVGKGREGESYGSLVASLLQWLTSFRLFDEEAASPPGLRACASFDEVTNWLHSVWLRFSAAEASEILSHKKVIAAEVISSATSPREQESLLVAVDYLSRLASARRSAERETGNLRVRLAATRHNDVQVAYRKLARLAATDLPVWLTGERGPGLDELARVVHKLRGLPDDSFQLWDHREHKSPAARRSWSRFLLERSRGGETTLYAPSIDTAPPDFQQQLYDLLVMDLAAASPFRTVVSSGPVDLTEDNQSNLTVELFAFLAPSRVRIVPLRNRMEDLSELIRFQAALLGFRDPLPRISPEAMGLLRTYDWPGNTEELKWVTAFMIKRRPSGSIGPLDLPDAVGCAFQRLGSILDVLQRIGKENGFRVLASEEGRRRLATFLADSGTARFTASDIQRLFSMGRETVRRLLDALAAGGLIIGEKGAGDRRVTGYRCVEPHQAPRG